MKEKNKPKKRKSGPYEPVLPKEFQQPETFRQKMEQKGAPVRARKLCLENSWRKPKGSSRRRCRKPRSFEADDLMIGFQNEEMALKH